jgi:hypothetical protein
LCLLILESNEPFDKIVRTPGKYFRLFLVTILSKFYFIPDKPYLKVVYWLMMNRKLNLDNPRTFNEKIQWLKLYDRKPEYTMMVDKSGRKRICCTHNWRRTYHPHNWSI